MHQIEQTLRARAGLEPAAIGTIALQGAIDARIRQLRMGGLTDYKQLFFQSECEWEVLIELVVIGETWFFRDAPSFAALVELVKNEWIPAHQEGRIELLSVPCSTGEEPYSLAMALIDAGVPPGRFHIEAIDISRRALKRARRGFYRVNSFRADSLGFRDRYFYQTATGYQIDPALGDSIEFRHGNLAGDCFETSVKTYDYVFCRNVLIYLDAPTRRTVLSRIEERLRPGGVVFVGPAEHALAVDYGFDPVSMPHAFASRRRGADQGLLISESAESDHGHEPASGSTRGGSWGVDVDLAEARRLADAGQFDEAASICVACLRRDRVSATAYYLLGLVSEAKGEFGAADFYRKALYLDPNHYETLAQLTLMAEQAGDKARAATYKRRALRARSRAITQ